MKPFTKTPVFEPLTDQITFSRKKSTGDASYAYHRHDGCEIYLFLSGNVRFYVEQTCFSPEPGSLVIINSNEMHRVQSMDTTPYERIVINLKREYLDRLSPDGFPLSDCFFSRPFGSDNLRLLSAEAKEEFLTLYEKLCLSNESGCFGASVMKNAYTSLLLLFVNRQFRQRTSVYKNMMPEYITGTMQYIGSHLDEPLSLAALAERFHISENYLSARFKYHTGLTLRSYFLDRKISLAKQLLREGKSVTEACFLSGFNDYANFLRSFRKSTGCSPGKFV